MFGKNRIVGPRDYKDLKDNELKITSIFWSLQGEGPYRGEPACFVRYTGCQRSCLFCDTYFDTGDILTFDQVFEKIKNLVIDFHTKENSQPNFDKLLLVITGGEPMLQKNLVPFLEKSHEFDFRTQIESNGDLLRPIPKETTLVVSPKTNEKTGEYMPLRPDVFDRANVLKFVVSADPTSPYHRVPEYASEFRKIKGVSSVFMSPMNIYNRLPDKVGNNASLEQRSEVDERISFWTPGLLNLEQNQANHEYAALLSMKLNFTLNLQTHLYASLP